MNPLNFRFALRLIALLAAIGLTFFAGARNAVAVQILSDSMTIQITGGPVLFQNVIAEGGAPATESSLAWDPSNSGLIPAGGIVPAGGLGAGGANLLAAITPFPGINYVILTEPANEPADPNELPRPIYNGPGGPVVVSDILVNGLNNAAFQGGQFIPFILFISDNNPDLNELVNDLNQGVGGVVSGILPETGQLQDLTALIGQNFIPGLLPPVSVVVQSDISTPEPSTFVLAGMGLFLLGFAARRRKSRVGS
jgi:hypothetical protein